MFEDTLVQKKTQETESTVEQPEATLPLGAVLQLISRLEGAGMLKSAFVPPGRWILQSEVPGEELVSALQEHLSKTGWRRTIEAMHRHNRHTDGARWELSRPADFVSALEQVLARWETTSENRHTTTDDLAPNLWRQVKMLKQAHSTPVGTTAWLLSPQALISRLNARAKRALTETQIENAVSEAALHTARMVGTDTERDVALKRVAQLREKLSDQLEVFCDEHGLPLPRPFSREEAYCLHLLNAYYVALAEAEGTIAKRGAALARRQITLEGDWAEARMDTRLLPGLLESRREINPLRESLFRERMRHKIALLVGGVFGAVGGGLWGTLESISEVLIGSVARHALVIAPPLLIGLMTLVAQTLAYSGPFTFGVVADFLGRALWNSGLALVTTALLRGCWLYYTSRRHHTVPGTQPLGLAGGETHYSSANND
jgi:hypothetical protein